MASSGFAKEHLKSYVARLERLDEERVALVKDIGEVVKEAKGNGFDAKTLKKIVALRKLEAADRQEQQAMMDLYLDALGMLL